MIQITLNARQHANITRFVRQRNDVQSINYVNQVAAGIGAIYDPEQPITVDVNEELVEHAYRVLGYQQSRLVDKDNRDTQAALLPQVAGTPLFDTLLAITQANAADQDQGIQAEVDFLMQINL